MKLLEASSKTDKKTYIDSLSQKAARNLMDFGMFMDSSYFKTDHIEFLIRYLEMVEKGIIKKLIIMMPPRHGKSETASVKFPAWCLGRNSGRRIIHASYAATLSNSFSRKTRNIINEEKYKLIFPDTILAPDSRAVDDWNLYNKKGGLQSRGVCGGLTGHGADLLIIDDPVKDRKEAESKVYQESIFEWYKSVAYPRLEPNAAQLIIMARWSRKDLVGRILEDEDMKEGWTIINLKALADSDDELKREEGKALWPVRFDEDALAEIKKNIGSKAWNSLYQGEPVDPESQIVKREWFEGNYYDELPINCVRAGGIDTATSLKTTGNHTSLVDACRRGNGQGFIYIDDVFLEKITVKGFREHVANQHLIKKYINIEIEENAAGDAVKQAIVEEGMKHDGIPIKGIKISTDKVVRLHEWAPLIENGTIKWKRGNKRVAALIEHLINFDGRGSDIDDDVDAAYLAVKALRSIYHLTKSEPAKQDAPLIGAGAFSGL